MKARFPLPLDRLARRFILLGLFAYGSLSCGPSGDQDGRAARAETNEFSPPKATEPGTGPSIAAPARERGISVAQVCGDRQLLREEVIEVRRESLIIEALCLNEGATSGERRRIAVPAATLGFRELDPRSRMDKAGSFRIPGRRRYVAIQMEQFPGRGGARFSVRVRGEPCFTGVAAPVSPQALPPQYVGPRGDWWLNVEPSQTNHAR